MATPPRAQYADVIGYNDSGTFKLSLTSRVTVYVAPPFAAEPLTTLATIRSGETGSGTPGNPFDPTTGKIEFWAAPGSYDIQIQDLAIPAKYATKVIRWESQPGDKGIVVEMVGDDSVDAGAIAANAVGASEIAADAVGASEISAGAVGSSELATDAVTTAKITDSSVTLDKLASNSVNASKIVDESVGSSELASGSVTKVKLSTDVLDAFLKLDIAADKELRFGKHTMTSGFSGGNRAIYNIPHGLGRVPDVAFVWAEFLSSIHTSTVENEPVIASLHALSSTNIETVLAIANGATAAVGTALYWAVIG